MSTKLSLILHGKVIEEYLLESSQEYTIGRGEQCDIILDNKFKKISRQHVKIYDNQGIWVIESLTKSGAVYFNGNKIEHAELESPSSFEIPPYEFKYEYIDENKQNNTIQDNNLNNQLVVNNNYDNQLPVNNDDNSINEEEDESTNPGFRNLSSILKVIMQDNSPPEVYTLDAQKNTIGRSEKADIQISSTDISRQHFQIYKDNQQNYWIKDLGSSNGTSVNGQIIEKNKPVKIISGDLIEVISIKFYFEIRDLSFDKQLQLAQLDARALDVKSLQLNNNEEIDSANTPKVMRVESTGANKKNNKKRLIYIAIAIIILFTVLMNIETKDKNQKSLSSTNETQKPLTPEQKKSLRDSKILANSYRQQNKYRLCLEEINKIHQMVPFFENSKEIEVNCRQGEKMVLEQRQREEVQKKLEATQDKIKYYINYCTKFVNSAERTELEIQQCLTPVFDLDPANAEAKILIDNVKQQQIDKLNKQNNQRLLASKAESTKAEYFKIQQYFKARNYKTGIRKYTNFVNSNSYDPNNYRLKARKELKQLEQEYAQKVNEKINECESFYIQQNYNLAIPKCLDALEIDPKNPKANELINKMKQHIFNEVKKIYQDSVLEEGMGNVERAKQLWQSVIEKDIPGGDYYNKAKRKLKKYNSID